MATAATVFRDYESDGIPSSGAHKVKKGEVRTLLGGYEQIVNAFLSNGGLIYTTRSSLFADLAHSANSSAWVIGDSTAAYNGVYMKIGSSGTGSWTRVADLPYSHIRAVDVGAGTPNAIIATSDIPVSSSALIAVSVFEANTASPVTIQFNGGTVLTVKTNSGNDVAAGGFVAGMIVLGFISGSTFRLISDQASSAIQAAAEAAQAAAEAAAAAATGAAPVANRAAMKLLTTSSKKSAVIYNEGGRNGLFVWNSSNLSAMVTIDTQEAKYVAPNADATGAAGAWVRISEELTVDHFGGVSGSDSTTALQAALAFCNATGDLVVIPANRQYLYSGSGYLTLKKGRFIGKDRWTSVIYRNDGSNKFIKMGDESAAQFSCIGIQFRGFKCRNDNPTTANVANDTSAALLIENAFVGVVDDMDFDNVTRFVQIGHAAKCATIDISNSRVKQRVCNISAGLIEWGGGITLTRIEGFVSGGEWITGSPPSVVTAGYAYELRPGTGQEVDTVKFVECQHLYFYNAVLIQPMATGAYVVNIWNDSIWDSCAGGGHDTFDGGRTVANLHYGTSFWVNCYNGYGYRFSLSGATSKNFYFTGCHIFGSGFEGMFIDGTRGVDRSINITGGGIDAINKSGSSLTSAINIALDDVNLHNVKIGGIAAGFTSMPDYGITVHAAVVKYTVVGCAIKASSADWAGAKAHTVASRNRFAKGNTGLQGVTGVIPSFAIGGSNVLYENKTPFEQLIFIYGGTVTGVYLDETSIPGMTSGQLLLKPGWSARVIWSSSPTISSYYQP